MKPKFNEEKPKFNKEKTNFSKEYFKNSTINIIFDCPKRGKFVKKHKFLLPTSVDVDSFQNKNKPRPSVLARVLLTLC